MAVVEICLKSFGGDQTENSASCGLGGDDAIWDGTSAYSTVSSSWVPVTGTLSWSYSDATWPPNGRFRLMTRGTDNSGNVETVGPGNLFNIDNAQPTAGIIVPAHNGAYNALSALSGTATDHTGGGGSKNPADSGINAEPDRELAG